MSLVEVLVVGAGATVGALVGHVLALRWIRRRRHASQVEAVMRAVFGPPHRGVYRAPPQ